jgi:hypothetical protein
MRHVEALTIDRNVRNTVRTMLDTTRSEGYP